MIRLARQGHDFRLALMGARGRQPVAALDRLRVELPERVVADGFLPKDEYRSIVSRAGIVVSTAAHEFQGLAMLEAVSAGALPIVPDGLCYPEQYPARCRYAAGDARALTSKLVSAMSDPATETPDVSAWTTAMLKPAWRTWLAP
jgi:hypothetical protein